MKYIVDVAGRRREVVIEGNRVRVDGVEHRVQVSGSLASPRTVMVIDGVRIPLVADPAGRGKWIIYAEGERWEAEVGDERAERARRTAAHAVGHAPPPLLKAPMPGLVIRVLVESGQEVAAGASVVVLEAMKMENELKASGAGVVDQVLVTAGQTVERGQVLVRFRGEARGPSQSVSSA
ncbi:MAG: biotin/lipoyl-containing protein [Gemmatimonadales bacterium]